jgi:hypothetical protein
MDAAYHQPGTPILGSSNPPVAEKTIIMDDLLISPQHSSTISTKLLRIILCVQRSLPRSVTLLQKLMTRKCSVLLHLLRREAHPVTASPGPEPGGSVIKLGAGNEYNAQAIVDAFFEAASILDEKNVPRNGRTAVLSPRQYYALISQVDSNILNRDYGSSQGNMNSGEGLYEIAGISIKRSNNLPFMAGNVARVNGENNDYSGDFSASCGLIYMKDAAGVVEGIGPQVQTTGADVKTMYQGDIIVGRQAMGVGTLNPACAIELQAA